MTLWRVSSLDDDLVFPHRWYQSRKKGGRKGKKACNKSKGKKRENAGKKWKKRPVVTKATDPDKNPPTLSIFVRLTCIFLSYLLFFFDFLFFFFIFPKAFYPVGLMPKMRACACVWCGWLRYFKNHPVFFLSPDHPPTNAAFSHWVFLPFFRSPLTPASPVHRLFCLAFFPTPSCCSTQLFFSPSRLDFFLLPPQSVRALYKITVISAFFHSPIYVCTCVDVLCVCTLNKGWISSSPSPLFFFCWNENKK